MVKKRIVKDGITLEHIMLISFHW